MLDTLTTALAFSHHQLLLALSVVFLAGVVRGFSGFALSALTMASLVSFIPPITLIPLCFFLELSASLLMARGGFRHAEIGMVAGLLIGSAVGLPVGLWLTRSLDPVLSQHTALLLILVLAILQLVKQSPAFFGTPAGRYVAGFSAGIATGLASIGGMVVALFVLAQHKPARVMRASLVVYLFGSSVVTGSWLYWHGLLDVLTLYRAFVLVPVTMAGVVVGSLLFRPSLAVFYKQFCLILLCALAIAGLVRLTLT